jgi:toxin-antitoxin system PIN domain toxin
VSGIIDTNVLLYAANSEADEHEPAVQFISDAARSPDQWYLTEGILYEFLRVSTHPRVFERPLSWSEAVSFLSAFVASDRFRVITAGSSHWPLLKDVLAELTHPAGNLFFDIRTAVLMREHGIRRIYTTDTDFLQFSGLETINPLRR